MQRSGKREIRNERAAVQQKERAKHCVLERSHRTDHFIFETVEMIQTRELFFQFCAVVNRRRAVLRRVVFHAPPFEMAFFLCAAILG